MRSAAGTFTLQGVLPYRVHVIGDVRAAALAPMPVDVYGTLGKDRFTFERAEVELYGGHTSAQGEVVWSGAGSWEVSGRATGINPGLLRADLPGSLNFNYTTTGRGFARRAGSSRPPRSANSAASCAAPAPAAAARSPTAAARSSSPTCA